MSNGYGGVRGRGIWGMGMVEKKIFFFVEIFLEVSRDTSKKIFCGPF